MNLKIHGEEFRNAIFQDHEDWELIEKKMVGQRRWVTEYEAILHHLPTVTNYGFFYDLPSTESSGETCDTLPGDSEIIELKEMELVIVETKKWQVKK